MDTHVVFGTGQVGTALAGHLAGLGIRVRAVSRHRSAPRPGTDWRAADVADPEAAADAAKGASVIYQCLNAPYTQWPSVSRRCIGACSPRPSAPARCWSAWRTCTATARPGAGRFGPAVTQGSTLGERVFGSALAGQLGHRVGIRSVPKLAVRALSLASPLMRELAEMSYQFDQPFVLDTSKYESVFGAAGTPLADAVAATLAWYRSRTSAT